MVTEGEAGGGGDRAIWILAGVGAAEVVAVVVLVGVAIRRRARKVRGGLTRARCRAALVGAGS